MNYWNETCMVSRLPIRPGDPVVLMFLGRRNHPMGVGLADSFFAPVALPVFGKYDGLGGLSDLEDARKATDLLFQARFLVSHPDVTRMTREILTRQQYGDPDMMVAELLKASAEDGLHVHHFDSSHNAYAALIRRDVYDMALRSMDKRAIRIDQERAMGYFHKWGNKDTLSPEDALPTSKLTAFLNECRLAYWPVYGSKDPHGVDSDPYRRLLRFLGDVVASEGPAASTLDTPDFNLVMALREIYAPAKFSVVSDEEAKLISDKLKLADRTNVELCNIRNTVVMLYSQWAEKASDEQDHKKAMVLMDAMSAITAVIDRKKIDRGMPV